MQLRDGAPAFVHVLLEHKSTSDPAIALQLARYKSRIWEAYADGKLSVHWPGGAGGPSGSTTRVDRLWALPAIIPVVFYHGGDPWTAPFSIAEMILHKELGSSSRGSVTFCGTWASWPTGSWRGTRRRERA